MRDNTGLVYSDSNGQKSYGHLLNIIIFEESDYCGVFVTAISLCRSGVTICRDSTTNARVGDHYSLPTTSYVGISFTIIGGLFLFFLFLVSTMSVSSIASVYC